MAPKGTETTRPITDRVKQSLFDRLTVRGMLDEGYAVDLFAGSGSIGIEALSRGIDHCTFVERHRGVRMVLEQNINSLGLKEYASVLGSDVMSGAWLSLLPHRPVQLVFCDPPYAMTSDADDMERVMALIERIAPIVSPGGVLVLRTDEHAVPRAATGWVGPETIAYGAMRVHLYDRESAEPAPAPVEAPPVST
jgi:16S rRNA (guanine(966)-N(2))-methyltransferase RsmD